MCKIAPVDFWACVTLAVAALVASTGFYSFPLTDVPVNVDSAVFGYIGEVMASGGTPYADVFDHKGPLIYLLNLIGALGPSTWTLWLVECVFLAASLCLAYGVGRAVGAPRLASAAVAVLLVSYIVFHAEGGNMTEEYCLPFMLAVVLLSVRVLQGAPFRAWHGFVMGACAACVFMLRFTELLGLFPFCVAVLVLTWSKRGPVCALARTGAFLTGFAVVAGGFVAWLALKGALLAFGEQYFAFNLAYASDGDVSARWWSLRYFMSDPALLLAVIATGISLVLCWAYRHGKCGRETAIVLVNFAGLMLLFALAAFSGRSYGHYLLMFVPMYFVAFGSAVLQLCRAVRNRGVFAVIGVLVGLAVIYVPSSYAAVNEVAYRKGLVEPRAAVVEELRAVSSGGEVLVVGNECWVYLDGGFRAPAPYAYRSDAMADSYSAWLAELVADPERAPAAIAVADYVVLDVPLEGYSKTSSSGGFAIFVRNGA